MVLGLVQGATENARVVSGLLDHPAKRGLDFSSPGLYLLDGSRALRAAIVQHAGEAAFFQRCQVHKIRNVLTTYPIPANNGSKISCGYAQADAVDALRALYGCMMSRTN